MNFTAQIKVMPLKDLLDPQGKAVLGGLHILGLSSVGDVRIGKHIDLQIEAKSKEEAEEIFWSTKRFIKNGPSIKEL